MMLIPALAAGCGVEGGIGADLIKLDHFMWATENSWASNSIPQLSSMTLGSKSYSLFLSLSILAHLFPW